MKQINQTIEDKYDWRNKWLWYQLLKYSKSHTTIRMKSRVNHSDFSHKLAPYSGLLWTVHNNQSIVTYSISYWSHFIYSMRVIHNVYCAVHDQTCSRHCRWKRMSWLRFQLHNLLCEMSFTNKFHHVIVWNEWQIYGFKSHIFPVCMS